MIPKLIHYCWFGGKPLPQTALDCIASWKKFFPDYKIVEWNEKNFNIDDASLYCREAYAARKYAFVSDYARFKILNENGGVYFDVDVEVIKPMDDILSHGAYMGIESIGKDVANVNPGLGMACEKDTPLLNEIIAYYDNLSFVAETQKPGCATIVTYVSGILKQHGMKAQNSLQMIGGFNIYPIDFFSPKDYETGKIKLSSNSRSIHHFIASWHSPTQRIKHKILTLLKLLKKNL